MPSASEPLSDVDKKLKLKIDILTRCTKELEMYQKEAEEQVRRIASLEASNACPHDIRKQYEVLNETKHMIPDCEQRAERAKQELSKTILTIDASVSPNLLTEARALI